jgi:L-aminopeptidase/D-esterase-like protein
MGYQACLNASDSPPAEGNVGVGMGATVGKAFGMGQAMKAGVGSASLEIGGGLKVAALAAVNAFGDVIDPHSGAIIAGLRGFEMGGMWMGQSSADAPRPYFASSLWAMQMMAGGPPSGVGRPDIPDSAAGGNTVIGVVATNARLDKEQANKVAQMAQDGLARSIRPAHTMLDGDTIFALSLGEVEANVSVVGAFAAEVFAEAVVRAARAAKPLAGLPAAGALSAG